MFIIAVMKRQRTNEEVTGGKKVKKEKETTVRNKFVLDVKPADNYLNDTPFFRQPAEFGAFSLDINRKYLDTKEKLRQYVPSTRPDPKFDLKVGFKTFFSRDEDVPERLDHMLQWVSLHRDRLRISSDDSHPTSLHTDFVTWRGHLVKILLTPYEKREPWQMDICRLKGTIFISEVETKERKEQRLSQSERQKEMCYWGYKFEDYMAKPFSGTKALATSNDSINNCEAFCSVIRTRLNNHSLLFGAEVDCCTLKDGKVHAPDSYVELKTTRITDNPRLRRNFANFKLIKFWAQSFLAGVPRVVCGMRDDNGIVRQIESFNTLRIPEIASKENARWNPTVCLNFLDQFLKWVKTIAVQDNPNVIYSFKYQEPFDKIEAEILAHGENQFLPDWFL